MGRQLLESCSICHEDLPATRPTITSFGTEICVDCLTRLVTRVLEDKDQYPVNLDNKSPFDFSSLLDADLLEQYKHKELEHKTFPSERVYCSCGKFIGRLLTLPPGEEYIAVKTCNNTNCDRYTCMNCATKLGELAGIIDHGCNETRDATEKDRKKMVDSDERGKKFQLCPNCSRPIELTEACHHIACPCGTEFCYLCGEKALDGSNHWRAGRCPRYPSQRPRHPVHRMAMNNEEPHDVAERLHGIAPGYAAAPTNAANQAERERELERQYQLDPERARLAREAMDMLRNMPRPQNFHDDQARAAMRRAHPLLDPTVPLPPARPEPRNPPAPHFTPGQLQAHLHQAHLPRLPPGRNPQIIPMPPHPFAGFDPRNHTPLAAYTAPQPMRNATMHEQQRRGMGDEERLRAIAQRTARQNAQAAAARNAQAVTPKNTRDPETPVIVRSPSIRMRPAALDDSEDIEHFTEPVTMVQQHHNGLPRRGNAGTRTFTVDHEEDVIMEDDSGLFTTNAAQTPHRYTGTARATRPAGRGGFNGTTRPFGGPRRFNDNDNL